MDTYGKWSVSKLKAELRRRGAVTTGRKSDLVDRLESYDRNDNFYQPVLDLPEPVFTDWPVGGFRQLTPQLQSELPSITNDHIRSYFVTRMACDHQQTGDIKALQKGQHLVDSLHVQACSMLTGDDFTFFTGIVKAAMKKKISYNVKVKVDKDSVDVTNSDCECPAGKGPHATCKHVAALLIMLEKFQTSGCLICRRSCTDVLQTFHQPRQLYEGSPVKVSSLRCKRKAEEKNEDPRPERFRGWTGYQQYVNNLVTNFCWTSSKDLACRYLQPKADILAAVLDHDYLQLPYTQYWVDEANKVSSADITDIESATRGQTASAAWFHERSWRLTASRFGDIMKCTARRNMIKLCESIVFAKPLMCKSVLHGQKYEKAAIQTFQAQSGEKVLACGLFVDPHNAFLAASPDGIIGTDKVVEVKCPYRGYGQPVIPNKNFPFLELRDESVHLKRNASYYYQIQGQLGITGRKSCYFVVYTGSDIFVEDIAFDAEYWALCMVPRLTLFYEKHLRPYIAERCFC